MNNLQGYCAGARQKKLDRTSLVQASEAAVCELAGALREVCLAIAEFLMQVVDVMAQNKSLQQHWNPRGPWK